MYQCTSTIVQNILYLVMDKSKREVSVNYNSGWKMELPADGLPPRLFMEWIVDYQKEHGRIPDFKLYTDTDCQENAIFKVHFWGLMRNDADGLRIYMNENL
jgi:hypothetical protein